jgi:hypothetical protein
LVGDLGLLIFESAHRTTVFRAPMGTEFNRHQKSPINKQSIIINPQS